MNTLTFIVSTMLALALGYFMILLMIRIRANVITGLSYRQALQNELSALRIGRMLTALNINRERYLNQQSTLDIHQHMQRCRECDNIKTCDEKFNRQAIDKDDIDYCNNAESMKTIISEQNKSNN